MLKPCSTSVTKKASYKTLTLALPQYFRDNRRRNLQRIPYSNTKNTDENYQGPKVPLFNAQVLRMALARLAHLGDSGELRNILEVKECLGASKAILTFHNDCVEEPLQCCDVPPVKVRNISVGITYEHEK